MKVLDLHCPQGHVFEGWFASEDDFQSQLQRQLVQCPVCGDSQLTKGLSAPRINLGAAPPTNQREPAASQGAVQGAAQASSSSSAGEHLPVAPASAAQTGQPPLSPEARAQLHAMQAAWVQWSREVAAKTEDVGPRFTEEVRRMHYGETDERAIRGQASAEQAMELLEEGIGVMPLALPEGGNGKLQ